MGGRRTRRHASIAGVDPSEDRVGAQVQGEDRGGQIAFTVLSSSPEIARRIIEVLSRNGLRLEPPDGLLGSVGDGNDRVAVVDTRSVDGAATLRRIHRRRPELAVVAVVSDDALDTHVAALREGAATAVPTGVSDHTLLAATFAAVEGCTLLPNEVAVRLSRTRLGDQRNADLDDVARRILELLAHGDSIRDIADTLGYSERQTHRKANDLYRRLGASGRAEALVKAASRGLVGA